MTVRFKCVSEYQKSYRLPRSRSVSPQRSVPLAGRTGARRAGSQWPSASGYQEEAAPPAGPRSHSAQQEVSSLDPEPPTPPGEPGEPEKPRLSPDTQPGARSPLKAVDGQQPLANGVQHALRFKAGLDLGGQRSEYHRQFSWKKLATPASPVLTAQQVLYSSSRFVPPFKKHPVSMETEYRHSFLDLAPPTGHRLRKHLEHQRVPLFHTHTSNRKRREEPEERLRPQQQDQSEDTRSPQKATPPPQSQGGRRDKTEYQARFRSPLLRIHERGGVTESPAQQLQQRRRQALMYRSRAWGLHFSRAHLSQLLSEHNALWEPVDTTDPPSPRLTSDLCSHALHDPDAHSTSCVEALDLASNCSSASKRTSVGGAGDAHTQHTLSDTHTEPGAPADRRLAWGEEHLDSEEGRLPTPRLKMQPFKRTHHDRTTPATGGALLVGRTDTASAHRAQRTGLAVSMTTGAKAVDSPQPRQEEACPDNSPSPNHKPPPSPPSKPIRTKQRPSTPPPLAPPPPHRIQGTMRHPDFQHNGELGSRFRELQCSGGGCGSDEGERPAVCDVMSCRSAASCSVASAVLERAEKRRADFWGKR
ncbi:nuclear protein MDM1 isoform X3 [Myripristis murdjan]|uniref:nuclear protein MDM1 isoform X3 n=1 Tax=Myripristis murdjan TaxID=586833 RepID=UPI001176004F|nr:nuclear protein MDM1 isoform X3 [Myripristis murdjan]